MTMLCPDHLEDAGRLGKIIVRAIHSVEGCSCPIRIIIFFVCFQRLRMVCVFTVFNVCGIW